MEMDDGWAHERVWPDGGGVPTGTGGRRCAGAGRCATEPIHWLVIRLLSLSLSLSLSLFFLFLPQRTMRTRPLWVWTCLFLSGSLGCFCSYGNLFGGYPVGSSYLTCAIQQHDPSPIRPVGIQLSNGSNSLVRSER